MIVIAVGAPHLGVRFIGPFRDELNDLLDWQFDLVVRAERALWPEGETGPSWTMGLDAPAQGHDPAGRYVVVTEIERCPWHIIGPFATAEAAARHQPSGAVCHLHDRAEFDEQAAA
jgi:hypothetical protein